MKRISLSELENSCNKKIPASFELLRIVIPPCPLSRLDCLICRFNEICGQSCTLIHKQKKQEADRREHDDRARTQGTEGSVSRLFE